MIRTIVSFLVFFSGYSVLAQKNQQKEPAPSKSARVNVTVTDMKGKPRKGEEVVFRGDRTGKVFIAVSDAAGKLAQELPPGDRYIISLKVLSDTTSYTSLDVPSLGENEYFTDPFWINIKYEPARHFTLDNVHFDFAKATLRPDSFSELSELVDYLQRQEGTNIEIAGHTDNIGNAADNLKLSQQRANAIRDYLIKKGIKATRVIAKGYGAGEPVADNATEEGRQLNRRTEVKIL